MHVGRDDLQAVPVRGEGARERGVHVPVRGLAGRLRVGRERDPLAVRQVRGEPAAALRHGLRVAADPLDVAEPGPRPPQQRERDRDLQFRHDDQVVPFVARSSSVAVTTPSTELSMGTTARSAAPSRTAARAAWMVGQDSGSAPGSAARSAASEKVPSGPR